MHLQANRPYVKAQYQLFVLRLLWWSNLTRKRSACSPYLIPRPGAHETKAVFLWQQFGESWGRFNPYIQRRGHKDVLVKSAVIDIQIQPYAIRCISDKYLLLWFCKKSWNIWKCPKNTLYLIHSGLFPKFRKLYWQKSLVNICWYGLKPIYGGVLTKLL